MISMSGRFSFGHRRGRWKARLLAQDVPLNVGPQVFASDLTLGGALDQWAVFGGHLPPVVLPLVHSCLGDPKEDRKSDLGADD